MAIEKASIPGGAQRRHVVAVDHDLDALRRLVAPLRGEYEFHLTISASEALALLERHPATAIVAAQKLFSSSGLEVLAAARHRSPRTPRILLADSTDRRALEESAADAGVFQVLHHPCTAGQLQESLHAAVRAGEMQTDDTGEVEHVVMETPPEHRHVPETPGVALTVLTTDAQLYDAITAAVQGKHEVHLATRLDDAGEFATSGRCPVLVTDQALARPALERITRHLQTHEPSLVTIAVGTREQGNALMELLSTGAIHRFLLKPVTPGLARLAIDSACRQHVALKAHPRTDPITHVSASREDMAGTHDPANRVRELRPIAPETPVQPAADQGGTAQVQAPAAEPAFELTRDERGPGFAGLTRRSTDGFTDTSLRERLPIVLGALAVAAIAAAAWWFFSTREPTVDPRQADIARHLAAAQQAVHARELVAPPGKSAFDFYQAALALDPRNAAALRGLDEIAERFIEQAETHIVEGRLEDAQRAVETVKQVSPQHRRLRFLDTQLRKEQQDRLVLRARESATSGDLKRAGQLLEEAAKVSPGTPSDSAEVSAARATLAERERAQAVARSLETARQRLAQGRVVNPPNDSAKFHLRAAQRMDPDNIAVQQAMRDLGARAVAEARQAVDRGQADNARTWIEEASDLAVPAAELASLRQSVDVLVRERPKNDLLQLVLRRTEENQLLEPTNDSATHYLARLRQLDPQYAGLKRAVDTLGAKLIANAQAATAQRQFDTAARLLQEARDVGYEGADLATAEAVLRTARMPTPFPARIPQEVVPKRVKYVAPVYPRRAVENSMEGWVDVSFAVNAAGDVVDVSVVDASRRGIFDGAAIAAVRQWKFEARTGLDPSFTQRMRTRVEFRFQD